jgi:KDO2-lipid IV(A) lauroyltransferase
MALARFMPRNAGMRVFSAMGALLHACFRRQTDKAMDNLTIAFPQTPAMLRRGIARAMYKEMGKNCYEFINLKNATKERIVGLVDRIDGLEQFDGAYRRGRGVISVTGHLGCWELMAAHMRSLGYPVSVVARRLWIRKLDRIVVGIRESYGVNTIERDAGPRLMVDVLKRGEVLGMLVDQKTTAGGMPVPFFDRPAPTPVGAAKLACMTGAMIVPMAIYMNRNGKHKIRILKPLDPEALAGSKNERIERLTLACSRAVETLIRFDPKQWIWFHDRWSSDATTEIDYAAIH